MMRGAQAEYQGNVGKSLEAVGGQRRHLVIKRASQRIHKNNQVNTEKSIPRQGHVHKQTAESRDKDGGWGGQKMQSWVPHCRVSTLSQGHWGVRRL